MFGSIGGPEIILIFVVALLVFGPKRLPEIGKKVGRVLGEVRKATGDLRANVEKEIGIDPFDGLQQVGKARREIITTISEPVREAAKGTIGELRRASERAAADVRSVLEMPRGRGAASGMGPGAESGEGPGAESSAGPGPEPRAGGAESSAGPGAEPGAGGAESSAGPGAEPGPGGAKLAAEPGASTNAVKETDATGGGVGGPADAGSETPSSPEGHVIGGPDPTPASALPTNLERGPKE